MAGWRRRRGGGEHLQKRRRNARGRGTARDVLTWGKACALAGRPKAAAPTCGPSPPAAVRTCGRPHCGRPHMRLHSGAVFVGDFLRVAGRRRTLPDCCDVPMADGLLQDLLAPEGTRSCRRPGGRAAERRCRRIATRLAGTSSDAFGEFGAARTVSNLRCGFVERCQLFGSEAGDFSTCWRRLTRAGRSWATVCSEPAVTQQLAETRGLGLAERRRGWPYVSWELRLFGACRVVQRLSAKVKLAPSERLVRRRDAMFCSSWLRLRDRR